MKNFKKLITSFVLLFTIVIFTACSSSGQTKTYYFNENDTECTVKVKHEGDTIKTIDADININYKTIGVENKEQAEVMGSMAGNFVNSIDGLKYEIKYNSEGLKANVSIDFTKIDIDKFSGLLGMKLSEEEIQQAKEEIRKSFSLQEFEKNLLKLGFKEK